MRFVVPPPVADLGGDEVIAAKVGTLKPNSGEIFRFGSRPFSVYARTISHQPCERSCVFRFARHSTAIWGRPNRPLSGKTIFLLSRWAFVGTDHGSSQAVHGFQLFREESALCGLSLTFATSSLIRR